MHFYSAEREEKMSIRSTGKNGLRQESANGNEGKTSLSGKQREELLERKKNFCMNELHLDEKEAQEWAETAIVTLFEEG